MRCRYIPPGPFGGKFPCDREAEFRIEAVAEVVPEGAEDDVYETDACALHLARVMRQLVGGPWAWHGWWEVRELHG